MPSQLKEKQKLMSSIVRSQRTLQTAFECRAIHGFQLKTPFLKTWPNYYICSSQKRTRPDPYAILFFSDQPAQEKQNSPKPSQSFCLAMKKLCCVLIVLNLQDPKPKTA